MCTALSGITFIRYPHGQKIGKPNNLTVFGSKKTKGPKQENQLMLSRPEGGEP